MFCPCSSKVRLNQGFCQEFAQLAERTATCAATDPVLQTSDHFAKPYVLGFGGWILAVSWCPGLQGLDVGGLPYPSRSSM